MNINWTWLLIGIALGMFVLPPVVSTIRSKASA